MNVQITSGYITLGQLLKHINLVHTGGQVKEFVISNRIAVNGALTTQRGKKIYPGDSVQINDTVIEISG